MVEARRFRPQQYALAAALLGITLPCLAQLKTSPVIAAADRTNGTRTLAALKPLKIGVSGSMVEVLDDQGSVVVRGVQVSTDGYFLTKASEVPAGDKLKVRWSDQTTLEARRVHEDRALDLLLAHAAKTGVAAPFAPSENLQPGQWVTAATLASDSRDSDLRLGAISAHRRAIYGRGAGLGVRMEDDDAADNVIIVDLASDGPARTAGLQQGDRLLTLDGQSVTSTRVLRQVMSDLSPGQEVKVKYRRGPKENECTVRLASLDRLDKNFDGEDYGNGGVSVRTDGFPMVIQHAMPLTPADMGGGLYDLQGNAVGINIARADRVTTFALPTESFWTKAQEWMSTDRLAAQKK